MQKVLVSLEDDLDGGPADETVRFGLGGQQYEIDLSGKHAKQLRKMAGGYARCARKARGHPGRPAAQRRQAAAIRAWAKQQGHLHSDRGRIPAWVVDEYERVHAT
jgi:hypothetical protein